MSVQRKLIVLICTLLAVALCGCHGSSANLIGKWKGKLEVPVDASKKNDPGAAFGAAMANAMGSMMSVEFKSGNTFTMTMMMFPIEGTYSVSGDTVQLTPTKVMGMSADQAKAEARKKGASNQDMDKPMTFKIGADGKTLTSVPDKPGQATLTFEKESS